MTKQHQLQFCIWNSVLKGMIIVSKLIEKNMKRYKEMLTSVTILITEGDRVFFFFFFFFFFFEEYIKSPGTLNRFSNINLRVYIWISLSLSFSLSLSLSLSLFVF